MNTIGVEPDEQDLKFLSECGFEIITQNDEHQVSQKSINEEDNQKINKNLNTKPDQLKFDL